MATSLLLEHISKSFPIGNSLFSKEKKLALDDVSIQIEAGECWGIIGQNGAGKSTLLKIIAGITEPDSGKVIRNGNIASLIELGNGFHQDLTGMENLRFNAALLGMNKAEITKKADEIIAFAELESVIHHPIGTYSSGMVMRLGFSIAAHIETEIVLLDEVLTVGDSFFQQKCTDKILGMLAKGRTVVVVSHQTDLIRRICTKAALLKNGKLTAIGETDSVIAHYENLSTIQEDKVVNFEIPEGKSGFKQLEWNELPVKINNPISFTVDIHCIQDAELDLGFNINDTKGQCLIHISNRFLHQTLNAKTGANKFSIEIDNHLLPGTYYLTCFLRIGETVQHWERNATKFEVKGPVFNNYENPNEIKGSIYGEFEIKEC